MVYADYRYYKDTYLGTAVSETEFFRLVRRASQFLDYYTMGKANRLPESENLKMACCALVDQYKVISDAKKVSDQSMKETGGLKSETVGSYSVSYQTSAEKQSAAESVAESARSSLASVARQYLIGTNLLYRGRC